MPRELFILSRERERVAIDRATPDPAKRELLYQMVEAVWTVRETGAFTSTELAPSRAGFLAEQEGVWRRAGGWLPKLVEFAPELTAVMDELASHRDPAVRCHLCATLTDRHYPDVVVRRRLRRLLADASHEVREVAVGVCIERPSTRMVPALEAARDAESDGDRRKRLQLALSLVKGEPYWLNDKQ